MKNQVVIHHSATKDSGTVSWGAIERFHIDTNKWNDIGYHYGVELVGDAAYALVGRAEHKRAAAVKELNVNETGIHICVVGDFDVAPPPPVVLDVLVRRVLIPVMERWAIPPSRIFGHRDYANYKSCPGKYFDLEALRKRVSI